jgi:hypothetical protein
MSNKEHQDFQPVNGSEGYEAAAHLSETGLWPDISEEFYVANKASIEAIATNVNGKIRQITGGQPRLPFHIRFRGAILLSVAVIVAATLLVWQPWSTSETSTSTKDTASVTPTKNNTTETKGQKTTPNNTGVTAPVIENTETDSKEKEAAHSEETHNDLTLPVNNENAENNSNNNGEEKSTNTSDGNGPGANDGDHGQGPDFTHHNAENTGTGNSNRVVTLQVMAVQIVQKGHPEEKPSGKAPKRPKNPTHIGKSTTSKGHDMVYSPGDKPSFYGGDDELTEHLKGATRDIKVVSENPGERTSAVVRFIITSRGKVKEVEIMGNVPPHAKKEVTDAIKRMPLWKEGKKTGKKGEIEYWVSFTFN